MIQKITKKDCLLFFNQLKQTLENDSNFDCNIVFNENDKGGIFQYIKPSSVIIIGCDFIKKLKDNDFVSNKDFAYSIVTLFHEYQHALRNYEMYHNYQNVNQEIYVSSFTSAYLPYYYHKKHSMSPNEIDAELYGILNAKEFFQEFFPNFDFDFENAIVERVNELFEDNCWYGPFSDSELKVVFFYDDIINYLKDWQKISYNYNPLQDISNDKNFSKTIDSHLLDVNKNGATHYNEMIKYIKNF